MRKSLKVNAMLNTVKTVIGLIFPLITFPYISRVLNVEGVGMFNFSSSIINYFILFAGLGVATYSIREGVAYRDNRADIERFVSEVFSINMISTVVSYLVLFLLIWFVPQFDKYRVILCILSIEIIFGTVGINWIYNVYEDFFFITIRTIGFQILTLVGIFLFIKNENDLLKYVCISAFSNSAANLVNFIVARKKYCHFGFTWRCNFRKHLKPILIIFATSIAITIYVNSDITILGLLTDDYNVGLYSTAVKIYTIIKNILAAMLAVLIPRFSLLIANDPKEHISQLFTEVFQILVTLLFPVNVGIFMMSSEVIEIVAGESYLEGAQSLRLLSIAITFSLFAYMYTQCILVPAKEEKKVFRATLASAMTNIVLNFVLIPIIGLNAAAVTTIIAEAIVTIMAYKWSKKYVQVNHIGKCMFSVILASVAIAVICIFLKIYIAHIVIRMISAIVISAIVYTAILFITGNPVTDNVKDIILHRGKSI